MKNIIIKDLRGKQLVLFDQDIDICKEQDIYYEEAVEDFNDNDEISIAEEGFMVGYLAA